MLAHILELENDDHQHNTTKISLQAGVIPVHECKLFFIGYRTTQSFTHDISILMLAEKKIMQENIAMKAQSTWGHGRPQKFFQRGAKPLTLKKVDRFSARRTKN